MIEKALLVALVAAVVLFSASRLGSRLQLTFCEAQAALGGAPCLVDSK